MALYVYIRNISGSAPVSDYEVEIRVNRQIIARGLVLDHTRRDGWRELLRRIADSPDVEDVL